MICVFGVVIVIVWSFVIRFAQKFRGWLITQTSQRFLANSKGASKGAHL
jgi:hypothetical protein